MPKATSNGIQIYYETHGSGEPLVLISGIGYSLWQWRKMVPYLSEHFQVITFDNRGAGQTDKPSGPYSSQLLAADTAGLLDALKIEKAIIMGHSMGGYVAQAMALDFPEKISKLILCATNFGGPRHVPVGAEAFAILTDPTIDPLTRFKNGLRVSTAPGWVDKNPELLKEWVEWRAAEPMDPAAYQAQLAVGLSLIPEEAAFDNKLQRVSVPTLILFGEHDQVVPPENAKLLSEQIQGSQVEIIPDAGHFFPIETPEAASQIVIDFAK